MRKRKDYEEVEFWDGNWHEVSNPNESKQYIVGSINEDNDVYKLEACIGYSNDVEEENKFKYWTDNRLTIKNPSINPFNNRDQYAFGEEFIDFESAKKFVLVWNRDAKLFIDTIKTNPNEKLLDKYYQVHRDNNYNSCGNILDVMGL